MNAPSENGWRTMDTAPKDRPIVAWCVAKCTDPKCGYSEMVAPDERITTLCLYHAEGLSAVGDGLCIVEWGGSWDDSTWEYPDQAWMPDWWFRAGSEFEEVANPVAWHPIKPFAEQQQ